MNCINVNIYIIIKLRNDTYLILNVSTFIYNKYQ